MMLVTLQQASDHLRRDTDADDADLTLKIHAASAAVLNYLSVGADRFLDSSGEMITDSAGDPVDIPYEVQAAVLLMVGTLYKDRDASDAFERGYLPAPVTALLYPLRTPTVE